jgi:CBS domain-containing protein
MGLRENLLTEPVTKLAMRVLITARPGTTVRQACEAMRQAKLGAVIVVDDAGHPLGMFNEKLLIRLMAGDIGQLDDPVSKHMTHNVVCMRETDTIAQLIATMQGRKLRWICVVDAGGKATALTGLRGVMEYVVEHHPRSVKVQPMRANLSMDQREGA